MGQVQQTVSRPIHLRLPPIGMDDEQEYRSNGVRLGWLLSPQTRQARIYRSNTLPSLLDAPDELEGNGVLVGFTLNLTRIWESGF